ncbi:MAG: hypothetical protein HOE48_02410 [Candidatus Latescibacteria bacterium]|jgi:hypothetical protein|nr:hypothetical protein [Candidatus Latescibacterota bacterium]MBT4136734.1 hypothetical protein [Candidatus Latescibacterota bacterium]
MAPELKKQIIAGVGMLDIRSATEEAISRIHRIEGVGTILCSPETAPFLTKISIEGVGSIIEVPMDAKIVTGQITLNKDSFQSDPYSLLMVGQVVVEADLSVEDVEKGLKDLFVVGLLICPQHLSGVFQSKMKDLTGQVYYYAHKKPHIVVGDLSLDEHYLNGLDEGSELMVVGQLRMHDVLSNEILDQKIAKISVIGKATLREENVSVYYSKLDNTNSKVTVIPMGHEWMRREITLDATQLGALSARNLYCTNTVRIADDVTPDLLDAALDQLQCTGWVLCPESLKSVLATKCDLLKTRVIFYDHTLWVMEDKLDLVPSRFEYLDDQVTLVVMDTLSIHPDVTASTLAERFVKIHNFGKIKCSLEQMGAIQARMGTDDGDLIIPKEEDPKEVKEDLYERIEGVGSLKL